MCVRPNFLKLQQMHLAPHHVIRFPYARRMNVSSKTMLWDGGNKAFMETKAQSVYNGLHQTVACNPDSAFPELHIITIASLGNQKNGWRLVWWVGVLSVIMMVHGWVGGRFHGCEE